jgi:hypothetical protein
MSFFFFADVHVFVFSNSLVIILVSLPVYINVAQFLFGVFFSMWFILYLLSCLCIG